MKNELIFVCVFLPFGWGEQECARYTEGVFLYELLFVCVFIPIRREKHNQSKTCFSRIALFSLKTMFDKYGSLQEIQLCC